MRISPTCANLVNPTYIAERQVSRVNELFLCSLTDEAVDTLDLREERDELRDRWNCEEDS